MREEDGPTPERSEEETLGQELLQIEWFQLPYILFENLACFVVVWLRPDHLCGLCGTPCVAVPLGGPARSVFYQIYNFSVKLCAHCSYVYLLCCGW